jgi:hypothetical protein
LKPAVLVATKGWTPEHWADRMRPLLPDRRILCTDREGVFGGPDADLAGVEHVLTWKPSLETLDRLPNLRVIFSLGAGVDHIFALRRLPDLPIVRIVDDRSHRPHGGIRRLAGGCTTCGAAPLMRSGRPDIAGMPSPSLRLTRSPSASWAWARWAPTAPRRCCG